MAIHEMNVELQDAVGAGLEAEASHLKMAAAHGPLGEAISQAGFQAYLLSQLWPWVRRAQHPDSLVINPAMKMVVLVLFDARVIAQCWIRNTNLPRPLWLSLSEHSVHRAVDYLLEHGILAQPEGDQWRLE